MLALSPHPGITPIVLCFYLSRLDIELTFVPQALIISGSARSASDLIADCLSFFTLSI